MTTMLCQEPLAPFHILFTCPHCQSVRQVPDQYVGQTGRCNTCGGAITITASMLPAVSLAPQPKEWYRERMHYFEYCRDHYERARSEFPPVQNDAYWQRGIQDATHCQDRLEQVARYEKLVADGVPWPAAFEHLVYYHAKEHDYERAFYFCAVYFHSNRWRNPLCAGDSYKLLKLMRKIEKKLHPDFEG